MSGTITSRNTGFDQLVERQMRNWEIARQLNRLESRPPARPVADFIAISRQVGSGGREVAEYVAQRKGWPLFDREILDLMAEHDEARRRVYASLDERDLSWVEESLRGFMDPTFSRNDFFHRLSETVLSIARQASAVFLGRGAGFILPREVGLRVRLEAPLELRVARHAERHQLAPDAARAEVLRLDRQRQEYIHKYFKTDESELLRSDLLINMNRFTPASAAELILSAHAQARRLV